MHQSWSKPTPRPGVQTGECGLEQSVKAELDLQVNEDLDIRKGHMAVQLGARGEHVLLHTSRTHIQIQAHAYRWVTCSRPVV